VPEVGGRVDPGSEAHEMLMSLFGGMSKGERNRVKIRVKAAMADMAEREGRFLGGRPPYGYRLVDACPHPNPEKAAAGLMLHRLEPDPLTAPVVGRIFEMYLGGMGLRTIARTLTDEGVPSPSAHDPARNQHRLCRGWSWSAIRAILENPRYLGHQVWGRQPRMESLLDPAAPQDGYVTRQRWADETSWVRSVDLAQAPLVDPATFHRAQSLMGAKGSDAQRRLRSAKAESRYLLAGRVVCAQCGRKMSGHQIGGRPVYRCRIRSSYALPAEDPHPLSVSVSERRLTAVTFDWLSEIFSPRHRAAVLEEIASRSAGPDHDAERAAAELRDAERQISRLVDAVAAGALSNDDVASKLRHLHRRRDNAQLILAASGQSAERLDPRRIDSLLEEIGGFLGLVASMTRDEMAKVIAATNVTVRYDAPARLVTFRAEVGGGVSVRVGGGTRNLGPRPLESDSGWSRLRSVA
jgi:site-specific DNA recombinase